MNSGGSIVILIKILRSDGVFSSMTVNSSTNFESAYHTNKTKKQSEKYKSCIYLSFLLNYGI